LENQASCFPDFLMISGLGSGSEVLQEAQLIFDLASRLTYQVPPRFFGRQKDSRQKNGNPDFIFLTPIFLTACLPDQVTLRSTIKPP
ncbi:MAG: hypothetical protein NTV80_09760, partial [Verrucomicrobia bacterium]|nr:hypothetical protein [Verrucomicrobiota bacterium]